MGIRPMPSEQEERETVAEPSAAPTGERYEQELSRSLGVMGNIAITLSSVTPASSVFIIVPFIILTAGTGAVPCA